MSATQALYPTFGNHRIYQLLQAETESAPNVVRLLSAETECPPKVPICPHSAPKPKFGRPLEFCHFDEDMIEVRVKRHLHGRPQQTK